MSYYCLTWGRMENSIQIALPSWRPYFLMNEVISASPAYTEVQDNGNPQRRGKRDWSVIHLRLLAVIFFCLFTLSFFFKFKDSGWGTEQLRKTDPGLGVGSWWGREASAGTAQLKTSSSAWTPGGSEWALCTPNRTPAKGAGRQGCGGLSSLCPGVSLTLPPASTLKCYFLPELCSISVSLHCRGCWSWQINIVLSAKSAVVGGVPSVAREKINF